MNLGICDSSSEKSSFKCKFEGCDKSFHKRSKLREHERIHTGERPYMCLYEGCTKQYARSAHLKRHHLSVHRRAVENSASLRCEYSGCNQTFVSAYNLKKHIARVHSTGGQYLCSVENCNKSFSKRCQLRSHLFEHQGVLPFQCHFDGCHKKFKQGSHLKRHLKSHDGYACNVDGCQQTFQKWSSLRKHSAVDHKRVHICNACNKTFPRRCLLGRHVRLKHSSDDNGEGVTGFRCPRDGCQRTYVDLRNVATHIASHHDGRTFRCSTPACNKTFSTQQKLKHHVKKSHDLAVPVNQAKRKPNSRRRKCFTDRLAELNARQEEHHSDAELLVNECDTELSADESYVHVERSAVEQSMKNLPSEAERCIGACQPMNDRRLIRNPYEKCNCNSVQICSSTEAINVISGQLNVTQEINSNNCRDSVDITSVPLEQGVI